MASWTPEDWTPPEAFGPFPILEICPDAPAFFAQAGYFTARDLRTIVSLLTLDVDHRDAEAIYRLILERSQKAPWVLPALEAVVADKRGVGGGRPYRRKSKVPMILCKMPLMKLRLKHNPHLHARTAYLLSPPVPPDIAVAAFCEYALASYLSRVDDEHDDYSVPMHTEARNILSYDSPADAIAEQLGDIERITDWEVHALRILHLARDHPDTASKDLRLHAIAALRNLAGSVTPSADAHDFRTMAFLSTVAAYQTELLMAPRRDTVLAQVAKLGLDHDSGLVDDETIATLSTAIDEGLVSRMRAQDIAIAELEEDVSDLRARIQAAGQSEDYALLAELAPKASAEKEALGAARAARTNLISHLECLLSGGVENHDDALDAIRAHLLVVAESDVDAPDAQGALTPALFDGAGEADEYADDEDEDEWDFPAEDANEVEAGPEERAADSEPALEHARAEAAADAATGDESGAAPDDADATPAATDAIAMDAANPTSARAPSDAQSPGADIDIEPASTFEAVEAQAEDTPPVSADILAGLIDRDLLGVAADAAESFEGQGRGWPIEAVVLKAAAGSRAPHREYGLDTQRFQSLANRAASDASSDLGSILLLGALIRPSILEKSPSGLRSSLPALCCGSLGQHLQQATEAISDLDYGFPPGADELARIAGAPRTPQRRRIGSQLGHWADTVTVKTSRWSFATDVMRHVASEAGPIGRARAAIDAGDAAASQLARQAIDALSTASRIEGFSIDYARQTSRPIARLHPKGVEYLERQFDEPLGLLDGWLRATAREGGQGQNSEARLRTTVGNLVSRLDKARAGLLADADQAPDALTGATARWIATQVGEALRALRGEDTGSFVTLEDALTAERDLLPAAVREALDAPELRFDAFRDMLASGAPPDPEGAIVQAREEGAFDTAMRLATRFGIDARDAIARDMTAFAETWKAKISTRSRRLKTLAKVDYKHQEEIARRMSWCDIALARLAALEDRSELHDLADLPAGAADLDVTSGTIEDNIRKDQVERIGQYRNERNGEEADALLAALDRITVEATEDRIAQLRDGRSAATFETDLGGLVSDFSPEFLAFAASPEWPVADEAFEAAVAATGPLYIEEDRRSAGLALIRLYRAIAASAANRQPDVAKIRALFEDVGYDGVKIHDFGQSGRTGVWQGRLSGTIRSVRTDDWFLPPVFGSQAGAGARFLLVGPDVLPETLMKALPSDTPSILLYTTTVDPAKRRELAEHLRANAIPALLVDEALVAFIATRRQTRARTIFECGLPYGRVEPYTTDAGQLPPEMFFGRGEEIRLIMSKSADGCLVYGGRQLGKSALLGHIARTQHAPEQSRIVVTREVRSLGNSEKAAEIWGHLASMLSPEVVLPGSRTAEDVSRDISDWLVRNPQGRIVAMFDEADRFMDADTRHDYPELAGIKKLMEETRRAFKVVFAGLHNVQRMHLQPNSPLAHLGQPICIGPLNRTENDKRAAHDLVVSPMRAAGFRFESHEAVEEILAWANSYPSLVQEYMKGLLSTLHGTGSGKAYKLADGDPLWPIPSDTLFTHRGFGHIESRIRSKFHLTLDLDPRYALVAYTLGRLNVEGQEDKARVSGFEPGELLNEARSFWPKSSEVLAPAAFEALLEELFDLGVLGRVPIAQTKRHRYLLGSRQVATMLGSEDDIFHALCEIEDKDPVVAYDRAIYRRRYTPGAVSERSEWHYCPLTDLQIERIVQAEDSPVQIVCGLEALGLSKIGSSLRRITETGRLPGARDHGVAVDIARNTRELRTLVDRRKGGKLASIVVFVPETNKEAHDAIGWLERRPQVLGGQVRPLLLLDAADTAMRDIANRRPEQSQFLAAWGAEMVRVHLHQIEKVELDTRSLREAILTSTGGIPSETTKLINAMRRADDPMEVAQSWTGSLRVPPSLLNGALGQALVMLDMADGGDYETLNDLVREHTGSDLVSLGPDLKATGLVSDWRPKAGHIRLSALGDLLRRRIER